MAKSFVKKMTENSSMETGSSSCTPNSRTTNGGFNSFLHNLKTLTPNSTPFSSTATIISSSFFKSVYLEEWWLIRNPHNALAVEGFSCSERQGKRLFSSTAITIRHDTTTLETVDGFTITISNFINRPRSRENGFSSEVCNRFLLGFPYNWQELTAPYSGEKTTDGCTPNTGFAFDQYSLDGMPVTRIRDIIMSTLDDSGNSVLTQSIFDAILGKVKMDSSQDPIPSVHREEEDMVNNNSKDERTPSVHKKSKVDQKSKGTDADDNGVKMTRRRSARLISQVNLDLN